MSGNVLFPSKTQLSLVLALLLASFLLQGFTWPFAKKELTPNPAASPQITDASKKTGAPDSDAKPVPTDSITVIGSRLPESREKLIDMPSNVTYKSSKDIDLVQPLTFQDAVNDIEGANFNDQVGNGLDTTFGLRGFSSSSRIVFLVDGVRVNEVDGNGVNFPLMVMNDMDSIQVDRGSSSPIYGSGAFAGVVNLTSGQPSDKPVHLFGSLEVNSFKGINFNQGFSGTLQDKVTSLGGKFKYYFNGGRDLAKGYRYNDQWGITSFDMKAEYELPEKEGRLYFGIKHTEDFISNPGELTFQQYKNNAEQSNKPLDGLKSKNTIIQLGADKKFWDDRITASVMGSMRPNKTHLLTTTATFTDAFNPDTDLVTTKSRDNALIPQIKYEDQWTDWLHNESLLGAELRHQSVYSLEQDAFQGDVVESAPRETERGAGASNVGIFWRESLNFFDKVIPYFSMRHDTNWIHISDYLQPRQNLSNRWDKSTLSTGITVHPLKFSDLFFNYSQGFRVPTISELSPFSGTISSGLMPEKSNSYETGIRLRYKDLAAYKTSFFVIDMEDEISFDSTKIGPTAPFGQNINIGASRREGIEQRIDLHPIQELALYTSATLMRAYVRDTTPANSPVSGRDLGLIPQTRLSWGGYVTPFKSLGEPFNGFRAGLTGTFTGYQHPQSYESVSQSTLNATGGSGHVIKAYTLWDFILSYAWREKQIYFKINNLFDAEYYTRAVNATSFGTAIYPSGTYTFVNPGAPREYVIGTKWEL